MPQLVIAQLKLRRAFRYGYFAFLVAFFALLTMFGIALAEGEVSSVVDRMLSGGSALLALALVIGLSVPLFFAFWSLVGSAFLGLRATQPSMLEGIRD